MLKEAEELEKMDEAAQNQVQDEPENKKPEALNAQPGQG